MKFYIPVVVEIRGVVEIDDKDYPKALQLLNGKTLDDPEGVVNSIEGARRILHLGISTLSCVKEEEILNGDSAVYLVDSVYEP